jgi:polysaccharide export outer membrane protein
MKTATAFLTCAMVAGAASAQSRPVTPQSRPAPATGDARTVPPVKPTTGTSNPAPAPVPNDYKLSLGDKLRIEVYREPQLSQSVEVRPDGKITLPLVGDVPAAGYTARELANTLTEQLREYVTTPVVTVIVAEALPPMFYVIGEVNAPGAQPLRTQMSVLQALAVAGGFREFANTKKIRILRRGASGTLDTIPFNYKSAVSGKDQPIFLKPGDTIVVP